MRVKSIVIGSAFGALMLAVPLTIFFSPLPVLLSDWYVRHEYAKSNFPTSNLPAEERLTNATLTIGYLKHQNQVPSGIYTSPEVAHLRDVRAVIDGVFITLGIAIGLGLIGFFLLLSHTLYRQKAFTVLLRGGQVTFAFMVIIGIVFFLSWNFAFSGFHRIFFEDGTWTFSNAAMLIRLFPEKFWQDAVLYYTFIVSILSIITIAIGSMGRRVFR